MIPYIAGVATGLGLGGIGCLILFRVIDKERRRKEAMAEALYRAGRKRHERIGDMGWTEIMSRN